MTDHDDRYAGPVRLRLQGIAVTPTRAPVAWLELDAGDGEWVEHTLSPGDTLSIEHSRIEATFSAGALAVRILQEFDRHLALAAEYDETRQAVLADLRAVARGHVEHTQGGSS